MPWAWGINVAQAEEYYDAVEALVDASTDDLLVTDIYAWSILDSASNLVDAYNGNSNRHPPLRQRRDAGRNKRHGGYYVLSNTAFWSKFLGLKFSRIHSKMRWVFI